MPVNISLGPLAQHENLNLQHRIRRHHGRRRARDPRHGAPLHAYDRQSSPEAAREWQCRHPGERFRGSYHRTQVAFDLTSLPAGATAASISTYMDVFSTAYILSGSDIMPAELVPTTPVKRSHSKRDREAGVICRIEGEEIAAIALSPFLIISLPLAGAAHA